MEVEQIRARKLPLCPILRAGLGMMEGCWSTCQARVSAWSVSIAMKKPSSRCLTSRNWCLNIDERMALVVDPMLATGGSMIATIDLLKNAGCTSIKVLVLVAAPEGIAALEKAHPDVELYRLCR